MTNPEVKNEVELNLPEPDSICFSDPEMKLLYSSFIEQLDVVSSGNVIVSDPYFLSVEPTGFRSSVEKWLGKLAPNERIKLVLSAMICRPFDSSSFWENESNEPDNPTIPWELIPPIIGPLDYELPETGSDLPAASGSNEVLSEMGLKCLMDTIPKKTSIEIFKSEGRQCWQIAEWSDEWAAVYEVNEVNYDNEEPFPWFLGFCRQKNLERNFIELLRAGWNKYDIGFYYTYDNVSGNWPLSKLALHADGDEGTDWDLIDDLLSLNDQVLETIFREVEDDKKGGVMSRIREIRDFSKNVGLADLSLAQLMKKVGGEFSLRSVEEKIPEWQLAYDAQQEKLRKKREKELAPFADTIRRWVKIIIGPGPRGVNAAIGYGIRGRHVGSFIEDYVIEHKELPSGTHDLGSTKMYNLKIGLINFDGVAEKAALQLPTP